MRFVGLRWLGLGVLSWISYGVGPPHMVVSGGVSMNGLKLCSLSLSLSSSNGGLAWLDRRKGN